MRTPARAFGRTSALVVGAAFLLSLWLPLADQALGLFPVLPNFEKRELATLPAPLPEDEGAGTEETLAHLAGYPRAFEAWYDDHFGLRSHLIRWHNVLEARVLGTAPNEEVLIGRDGWLYFAGQSNIEQYRALAPMPDELVVGWKRYLAIVREWVEDHGGAFLLVIGPSKATIHPEHLPGTVRRVGSETRLQQLTEALEADGRQWFLDLSAALFAAKERAPTYQRTDTHWNSWGSLVATRRLLEELRGDPRFASAGPLELEDYVASERVHPGGDIAELMGLTDLYEERDVVWEPRTPDAFLRTTEGLPPTAHTYHPPYLFSTPPEALGPQVLRGRVLVFHDSFGPYLADFLPRFFETSAWYWQYPPSFEAFAWLRPDLVIQEVGERVLIRDELKGGDLPFPLDPRIREDFARRRAFRASPRVLHGPLADAVLLPLPRGLGPEERALARLDARVERAGTLRLGPAGPSRELVAGRTVLYLELPGGSGEPLPVLFTPAGASAAPLALASAEVRAVPRAPATGAAQ